MAHQLILILNLVGLLLIDLFFSADPSITHNVPATMEPGAEVRVTMTVNKASLGGFAKLQLDLPQGLTATAIDTKGASFTFADQKAKFIWMALPSSPSFKVSYTLKADATARGPLTIQGRLSYIEDNERKTYDMAAATVDLGTGAPSPVAQITIDEDDMDGALDLVSAAGGAPVPAGAIAVAVVDQAAGIAPTQGPGNVRCTRTITPITEKEMLVELVVKKGNIRGFGKLQETIPAGFTAMEKSSDEAIFTAQDRIVKFVWLNLPARDEIKVVYKLRANTQPDGEYSIDGDFGYLLNDETQRATIGTSKFYIGAKALEALAADPNGMSEMDNQDAELALRQKQAAEEAAKKAQQEAQARAQEAAKPKPQTPVKKETAPAGDRIPGPEKGVVFKVQITAAHREVGRAYFKARHRYEGDFQIERHEGWIKYVTGRFTEYQQARDRRVDFVRDGHAFPGPFVTAYSDGERITVQQALMISNQKWVQ